MQALSALPLPFGGRRGGAPPAAPSHWGSGGGWVLGAQLPLVLHMGCLAQERGVR